MSKVLRRAEERTVDQAIEERIAGLTEWLKEHAPEVEQQRQLDEGSRERAYWHYGYLVALRDLRDLLHGRRRGLN
jgi:hypothetical protein